MTVGRQTQGSYAAGRRVIAVLTLGKHASGVWITNLVGRLRLCTDAPVDVVALESLDLDQFPIGESPPWIALVNRVSDAADPVLAKSCQSVLNAAALWNIPCFNGPHSYSIGSNKTLHHHVFAKAGCKTPRSVKIRFGKSAGGATGDGAKEGDKLTSAARMLQERGCEWPLLIKPNSAGFGDGIQLFRNLDELVAFGGTLYGIKDLGPSEDGVALLQEYIEPRDGSIYRVWFLNGKVQCAVQRSVMGIAVSDQQVTLPAADDEFTGGCAGGNSCSLSDRRKKLDMIERKKRSEDVGGNGPSAKFHAWNVPEDVIDDISRVLAVVGDDCDAGSVELLYDEEGDRVYFDLNMLSTLPNVDDGSVDGGSDVWTEAYDPWSELANAVMEKVKLV